MPESAGTVSDRCSFHVRGNTSTFYEKKSYRISLQDRNGDRKKENLLGIRDDDDWILLPMLTDTSRIREKTAYDLWNRMQAPAGADGVVSSSVHYTELLINNQYFGIYGLMTPVDGKLLGLTERDLLYKINTWEVPSDEEYRAFDSMEEVCKPNGISYVDLKYPARALAADGWEPMRLFQGYVYGAMSPEELEAAGVVIFCEPQIKPSLTWQAISRVYRMGQVQNVLVYHLLCQGTVDEAMQEILAIKEEEFDMFAHDSAIAEAADGPAH